MAACPDPHALHCARGTPDSLRQQQDIACWCQRGQICVSGGVLKWVSTWVCAPTGFSLLADSAECFAVAGHCTGLASCRQGWWFWVVVVVKGCPEPWDMGQLILHLLCVKHLTVWQGVTCRR